MTKNTSNIDQLPKMTEEQHKAAMEAALKQRRYIAQVKADIKAGKRTVEDVLGDETCERMRVNQLLKAVPGIGKARAEEIMAKIGIPQNRHIKGLGKNQRKKLLELLSSYGH